MEAQFNKLNVRCMLTLCLVVNMGNFESFAYSCAEQLSIQLRLTPTQFNVKNSLLNPPISKFSLL